MGDHIKHYNHEDALTVVCEAALAWADEYGPSWGDQSILLAALDLKGDQGGRAGGEA